MHTILPALRVPLFILGLASLAASAGCGLKGDLVLPERQEQPGQTDRPSQPRNEQDDQDPEDPDENPSDAGERLAFS